MLAHPELDALAIAHMDCDAFYAAIEKRDDPSLKDRPLIVGRLVEPVRNEVDPVVVADGQMLRLVAKERIELRVGKASLVMEADGHITLRGTDLVSHASRSNRIRGGSINLN